ncbi:MAG: RAD52 family DNA repair protein [Rhizobiales bacterium]|nr:RAD52 family DNA repair protein [Hyphomicrobiales bacterium]
MSFTEQQIEDLDAPLSKGAVKERKQGGTKLSYIEGWHAIAEANRIFGFDGWTRETLDVKCVSERERSIGQNGDKGFGVTYIAKVRVIVHGVAREGCGAGHGIDRDPGQAHESAIKEAETDAMKRALMTFGNPFGLALYDKAQSNVIDDTRPKGPQKQSIMPDDFSARVEFMVECREAIAGFGDADSLIAWWNSDEQKENRRHHQLDANQIDALKQAVINRRDVLTGKKAA